MVLLLPAGDSYDGSSSRFAAGGGSLLVAVSDADGAWREAHISDPKRCGGGGPPAHADAVISVPLCHILVLLLRATPSTRHNIADLQV